MNRRSKPEKLEIGVLYGFRALMVLFVMNFHLWQQSWIAQTVTVFGKRIAHGIHLATFISTLIGQKLPGFGTIYCSQTFDFFKPVYLGETIRTEVVVLEKLSHHRLRMQTTIYDSKGDVVLDGVAVVKTYR